MHADSLEKRQAEVVQLGLVLSKSFQNWQAKMAHVELVAALLRSKKLYCEGNKDMSCCCPKCLRGASCSRHVGGTRCMGKLLQARSKPCSADYCGSG